MSLAYLGPAGTFSESAALLVARDGEELVPCRDIGTVLTVVEEGEVDRGIVPIENALQGAVTATLDALAFDTHLHVRGELDLPIELVLGVRPGVAMDKISKVLTHPVPLAGCRRWLAANLAEVEQVPTASTASAARTVAEATDQPLAAIANRLAAERYGLEIIAPSVADVVGNTTRFVVVGHGVPARTGWDKTSLVVYIHMNRPGALLSLLEVFAERGISMTKIESRPTQHELGDYCFFVDVEGHLSDERVADALAAIHRTQRDVKLLGSFPRSDARPAEAGNGIAASDAEFAEARAWLDDLRRNLD